MCTHKDTHIHTNTHRLPCGQRVSAHMRTYTHACSPSAANLMLHAISVPEPCFAFAFLRVPQSHALHAPGVQRALPIDCGSCLSAPVKRAKRPSRKCSAKRRSCSLSACEQSQEAIKLSILAYIRLRLQLLLLLLLLVLELQHV
mmetsp:Transcript_22145/g.57778  ORF Transcript_22145/g.57778 Transcript_22145/m.57778 type:complete len:144 (+) Transcript_22145:868-1299(+)